MLMKLTTVKWYKIHLSEKKLKLYLYFLEWLFRDKLSYNFIFEINFSSFEGMLILKFR